MSEQKSNKKDFNVIHYLIRLLVVVIILGITSFLTPGFNIKGFWTVVLAGIIITILDYLVELFFNVAASPFGNGIKGFIISAIILYITQFFLANMYVSFWGAIIASIVIGILDAIIPGRFM